MKTKIFQFTVIFLATLIFPATSSAQVRGNGKVVSETREVGNFTGIEVSSSVDVYITKGGGTSIVVKADENLIPIITTKVSGGVLKISNSKSYSRARTLEVHVSMDNIEKLISTGSGDIYCEGAVPGNNLVVHLNGSGDLKAGLAVKNMEIRLNGSGDAQFSGVRGGLSISINGSGDVEAGGLQLENCDVEIKGSGDIRLKGSTENLNIRQIGSGDVNAYNLKAVNVKVSNAGSGDIVVHAIEKLDVKLVGSGDLTYTGSPKVKIESHGSGDVYRK